MLDGFKNGFIRRVSEVTGKPQICCHFQCQRASKVKLRGATGGPQRPSDDTLTDEKMSLSLFCLARVVSNGRECAKPTGIWSMFMENVGSLQLLIYNSIS